VVVEHLAVVVVVAKEGKAQKMAGQVQTIKGMENMIGKMIFRSISQTLEVLIQYFAAPQSKISLTISIIISWGRQVVQVNALVFISLRRKEISQENGFFFGP